MIVRDTDQLCLFKLALLHQGPRRHFECLVVQQELLRCRSFGEALEVDELLTWWDEEFFPELQVS